MDECYTITIGETHDYHAFVSRVREKADEAYYGEMRTWVEGMPANEMAASVGRQIEAVTLLADALRKIARAFGTKNSEGRLDDGVEARATEKLIGGLETQKAKFEALWRQHLSSQKS